MADSYHKYSNSKKAIRQFKELVDSKPGKESSTIPEEPGINFDVYLLVETELPYQPTHGLSDNENQELQGFIDPSNSIISESRIVDNGALQLQADYLPDAIDQTTEQI